MKKRLLALGLALAMVLALAACSSTCKEDGCNNEVYEDGLCEEHYAMHIITEGLEGLGELFG